MGTDIVVFTLHKSASMFIHRQCELLSTLSGIAYHSPNLPSSGLDARKLLTDREIWRARHGCFAPVRFFVDIPHVENYRIILHLRDPRDVLVSMFYSYCYIHPGEIEANTGYRREAAARGIDAFVLAKASQGSADYRGDYGTGGHVEDLIGNLPKRYRDYIEHFCGKPNVILVKYEEMVSDYRNWLEKFIAPFPIEDKAKVIDDLAAQSPGFFPKRNDDAMTHVRHVTPGDHKQKLQPSTIGRLNEIFSDVLDELDYERTL
ncbi:MAG: sulfotransferase domain-containing protein [Steroidobacteraceae bacterium]